MNILVINGPNLNMLGIREPEIYGKATYADLCRLIEEHAAQLGIDVTLYQSNHEGDLVDAIQQAYGKADGIVINPGAYTHTSIAILDALKAVAADPDGGGAHLRRGAARGLPPGELHPPGLRENHHRPWLAGLSGSHGLSHRS